MFKTNKLLLVLKIEKILFIITLFYKRIEKFCSVIRLMFKHKRKRKAIFITTEIDYAMKRFARKRAICCLILNLFKRCLSDYDCA